MPRPSNYPRHLLVLDTETEPHPDPKDPAGQIQRLTFGMAIWYVMVRDDPTRMRACVFRSADELWAFALPLLDRVRDLWTFAHNCAYDWQTAGLLRRVWAGDLLLYPPAAGIRWRDDEEGDINVDGLPFIGRFWSASGARLTALDSCNWFRSRLREIGKTFAMPKLRKPGKHATAAAWQTYCERDVEIVATAVGHHAKWCRARGLHKLPPSVASTAKMLWAKHYKPKSFKGHHDWDARVVERLSYFGGRVGAWRATPFDGSAWHSDVSSLFPAEMAAGQFPKYLKRRETGIRTAAELSADECLAMCGRVRLDARANQYPVRDGSEVWYVSGRFDAWLAGPEILRAYQAGELVHVGVRNLYVLGDLFSKWVTHWFGEKKAARRAGDRLRFAYAKMMLVSLYGKFGQKPPKWVLEDFDLERQDECIEYETRDDHGTCTNFLHVGPMTFRENDAGELPTAFPAVAAWVTSYARVRMDQLRAKAAPGAVFYQSVDGLYTDSLAFRQLQAAGEVARDELGKLRRVKVYQGFHARGANYVVRGGRPHLAGIRTAGEEQKQRARQVAPDTFVQVQFEGWPSMMRRPPDGGVRVKEVRKHMPGGWPRNVVWSDGRITAPVLDAWGHTSLSDALKASVRV